MQKKGNIIEYKGFGAVSYVKSSRARNISIRLSDSGKVRVTVPPFVSEKRAEKFLMSKHDWILSRLKRLEKESAGAVPVREGEVVLVRSKPFKIELKQNEPEAEDALWRILLREARNYLPYRVENLAAEHGFVYSGVRIRKMKSRWGSCTHKKGINLNSWLMMLPDHLSDYVILHELVHTRYPHHGPEFWIALDAVTDGKSKELRKELRGRKISLVYPENQFSSQGD
jgi:predicted metal-dependent hydrolase